MHMMIQKNGHHTGQSETRNKTGSKTLHFSWRPDEAHVGLCRRKGQGGSVPRTGLFLVMCGAGARRWEPGGGGGQRSLGLRSTGRLQVPIASEPGFLT